jgi:amidase
VSAPAVWEKSLVSTDEYAALDATAQAGLVRRGEVHPKELVEAAIARLEAFDPTLNALVFRAFDRARQSAAGSIPKGPFAGVPFLLKDLGVDQAGLPQYQGNRVFRDLDKRAVVDDELGARFRRAGLITLGKTNVPEFGPHPTTQPEAFGPARNPWDLDRTPGGSSGGSAAAVAAGLVPIAHANDGGGSIRIPASFTGLVGLKPSRGRVSAPTQLSRYTSQLAVTRTVRDTAAILDALHGDIPGQFLVAPPPAGRYVDELGIEPGRLRVGLLADSSVFAGAPGIEPDCIDGARQTAALLESLGHQVEQAWPPGLLDPEARRATGATWAGGGASEYNLFVEQTGREPTQDDVEPFTWARWQRAQTISLREYLKAANAQQDWALDIVRWWSEFDLLLTPTTGESAPTIEEMQPDADQPWRIDKRYARIAVFTMPFNVTGQPAISLPLATSPTGLPVGVQLVAAPFREDLLLRVAAQLEQAAPWSDRRPPVHA